MTNEEILDRLGALINKCFNGSIPEIDDATEATTLFTELRSRLLSSSATEMTMTTHITGSPEMIGMAIGKFISENTSPEEIARLREQIFTRVLQPK